MASGIHRRVALPRGAGAGLAGPRGESGMVVRAGHDSVARAVLRVPRPELHPTPTSRWSIPWREGLGPTLVPALGFLILDEKVAALAIVGIAGVVLGIYTVYWWGRMSQVLREPFKLLTERGSRYAVLTGLAIAAYSVWDKVGVRYVNPFLYMYLMALGTSIAMAPYMLRLHGRVAVRSELRVGSWSIVTAGMLTYLAYGLVLRALEFSKVSYIAPSREVGIVVGVLLGVLVLKEPFGRGRLFGSSLIVLGLGLIAVAP